MTGRSYVDQCEGVGVVCYAFSWSGLLGSFGVWGVDMEYVHDRHIIYQKEGS